MHARMQTASSSLHILNVEKYTSICVFVYFTACDFVNMNYDAAADDENISCGKWLMYVIEVPVRFEL